MVLRLLFAAILVLVTGAATPSADATFPGENGVIVFTRIRANGVGAFYTVDLSRRQRQLTTNARYPAEAAWAPDGRRLAGRFEGLRVLDRRVSLVDVPLYDPSWAPDGRRVVGDTAGEFPSVRLYNLATKQERAIDQYLHDRGYTMWGAAWSPNGRVIAHSSGFRFSGSEIWFHPVGRPRFVRREIPSANHAAWSPDSRHIAFDTMNPIVQPTSKPSIYVVPFQGGKKRLVVRNGYSPAWSPDGTKIAFVRNLTKTNSEIFVVNTDGSDVRRLTNNRWRDHAPDWQRLPGSR